MNVIKQIITGLLLAMLLVYLCGAALVIVITHPLYSIYYKRKNKKVTRL